LHTRTSADDCHASRDFHLPGAYELEAITFVSLPCTLRNCRLNVRIDS